MPQVNLDVAHLVTFTCIMTVDPINNYCHVLRHDHRAGPDQTHTMTDHQVSLKCGEVLTDHVHTCSISTIMKISGTPFLSINWFGHGVLENQIPALSRTFRHRFKDSQGPCLFSRTFQALKIWKKNLKTFKDPQESCNHYITLQREYRPWWW